MGPAGQRMSGEPGRTCYRPCLPRPGAGDYLRPAGVGETAVRGLGERLENGSFCPSRSHILVLPPPACLIDFILVVVRLVGRLVVRLVFACRLVVLRPVVSFPSCPALLFLACRLAILRRRPSCLSVLSSCVVIVSSWRLVVASRRACRCGGEIDLMWVWGETRGAVG